MGKRNPFLGKIKLFIFNYCNVGPTLAEHRKIAKMYIHEYNVGPTLSQRKHIKTENVTI